MQFLTEPALWIKKIQLKEKNKLDNKKFMRYLNMPFQMLIIIGLGVFAGIQLDKISGIDFPLFALIFVILSVILAIYISIKDLLK